MVSATACGFPAFNSSERKNRPRVLTEGVATAKERPTALRAFQAARASKQWFFNRATAPMTQQLYINYINPQRIRGIDLLQMKVQYRASSTARR
ncbi:MAG TPA: hypothetical protein VG168_07465 [Bryobacteraceae bacterium]|nr:hypothetical protein [Bryobacteraceae bacterium]